MKGPDTWQDPASTSDSGFTCACLCRLSCRPRSTWTATCWPCLTTCLCTTTPNTGGGPAAWTRQKVRPLLIWKMVGTCYMPFFNLRCFFFFVPSFLLIHAQLLPPGPLTGQTPAPGTEAPHPRRPSPLPHWRSQLSHPPHLPWPSLYWFVYV